jgi:helicase MOV-10
VSIYQLKNSASLSHTELMCLLFRLTPFIRLGDVVSLRQIQLDQTGKPLRYSTVYWPNGSTSVETLPLPGWSGREHCTVVVGVHRPSEVVTIKVSGPIDLPTGGREVPHFNFCFPPREDWIQSLWRAVNRVNEIVLGKEDFLLSASTPLPPTKSMATLNTSRGWLAKMLFPAAQDGSDQRQLDDGFPKLPFRDKSLNFEQAKAVASIQRRNYGTVPYLISGPPGTGKTKTLVETALQLCKTSKVRHILMCAPSDPAADTLVQRLKCHFNPTELLRLNSPSRTFAEVPMDLMPYCFVDATHFGIPPFKDLMKIKIVVVSCRDADLLVKARLTNEDLYIFQKEVNLTCDPDSELILPKSLHWGALLMDEAGQAIEPEALIPLTVVCPPTAAPHLLEPQFVMTGDHKQLGPRTASRSASIERSLFERLLGIPFYSEHPLARHRVGRVTKVVQLRKEMLPMKRPAFANLIRNYRSHPAIMAIPNSLFYHDTLLTEAPNTELLLSLDIWRGRSWPVLFSCNTGRDEVERDGGGWYNIDECKQAYSFAQQVLSSALIRQEDICIMSPFMSQVRRLRTMFRAAKMHSINIGPMEAFQGLESRLVILCTTRSRDKFLNQDRARGLGIIHEPKRFNVALTRAQQGLVVIGNPEVLDKDPVWHTFLDFCRRNQLWDNERTKNLPRLGTKERKVWEAEAEIGGRTEKNKNDHLRVLPALEAMLLGEEEGPSKRQLGQIATYDDPMWVQGMTEDEPDMGDLDSLDGDEHTEDEQDGDGEYDCVIENEVTDRLRA